MILLPSTPISLVFPHPFVRRLPGGPRSTTPALLSIMERRQRRTYRACCTLHPLPNRHLPRYLGRRAGSCSGADGCHLAAREAEASSRPGQRPSASAGRLVGSTSAILPHQSGAPHPLRLSVRWSSLERRPDATVHKDMPCPGNYLGRYLGMYLATQIGRRRPDNLPACLPTLHSISDPIILHSSSFRLPTLLIPTRLHRLAT